MARAMPSWDRRLYSLVLGICLALGLASILAGPISWDEESDYLGLRSQLAHGLQLLRGEPSDYHRIHANLEYYGIAGQLPAWLLWFGLRGLMTGSWQPERMLTDPAVEHQLTGYFAVSHAVLLAELLLLSLVVVASARRLGLRQPWLAGCLLLLTPTLFGHSLANTKDLPFALYYSLYTLALMHRSSEPPAAWRWPPPRSALLALLGATLMLNQKLVALLPLLISELLLALQRCWPQPRVMSSPAVEPSVAGVGSGHRAWPWLPVLLLPGLASAGALLLQPASWGVAPHRFLAEAFETFAVHSWGGCMWFAGRCVGIRHPDWSAGGYLLQWLPAKLPLLLLLLPLVPLLAFAWQWLCRRNPAGPPFPPALLGPLLQLLLIPLLAVLRNSNLYDADRHLLFVVPPLVLLALIGFERLQDLPAARPAWRGPRAWTLGLVALLAAGQLLDLLLLHPYQLAYFNEIARHRLAHTNTSVEYWSFSAKEALQLAQQRGQLPLSPTVRDSLSTIPLFVALRQLGGQVSGRADTELLFQVRNPPDFQRRPAAGLVCGRPVEVSRRPLLAPKLVMSRLYVCRSV